MAALHSALSALSPAEYSTIPIDDAQAKEYLRDLYTKTELIINSVPPPLIEDSFVNRPRSDIATSSASSISDITPSSARSEINDPAHIALRKEWGKPIKLSPKDNPLGVAVYKVGGKDGRGAWFARSSVHEGLGFRRWKHAFEREFPESLEVQGGPGEGNIRGIGGERLVEDRAFGEVGKIQVYQLSAQFPGPTTPRDFVTLLITTSSALSRANNHKATTSSASPRHYMVVSRPCIHPDCPTRDGFIRGQYESVEFVRELPRKPKKTSSTTDLLKHRAEQTDEGPASAESAETVPEGRKRGKTISYAEMKSAQAERASTIDLDEESDPVEWIMVTRSDPGGSVPRFMVERGTPAGIVGDAGKFVDWACKKERPTKEPSEDVEGIDSKANDLEAPQTNGHLAGLESLSEESGPPPSAEQIAASEQPAATADPQHGLLSSVSSAARSGIESYAPQAVIDRLPSQQSPISPNTAQNPAESVDAPPGERDPDELSTTASSMSFASAEEAFGDDALSQTGSTQAQDSPQQTRHERELAKLNERKKALDDKFAQRREKEVKDKEALTSKEQDRLRKAEEKHKRDVAKQEEKYQKEVAKLEARRVKEASKEEDRKKKEQDRDEKARLTRERDEARQELEVVKAEKEILQEQVGALQKENTSLVARLGKMNDGRSVLKELHTEASSSTRSRSSSLKSRSTDVGKEATVLGGMRKAETLK